MTEKITLGEFTPWVDGVEVAVVGGTEVERSLGVLKHRPPFDDAARAEVLSFKDFMEAKRLAVAASHVGDIAMEIGRQYPNVQTVVFSKTGALALKYNFGRSTFSDDAVGLIEMLDGGNYNIAYEAHAVTVG